MYTVKGYVGVHQKETIDFYLLNRYTILNSKNDWREHPVAYQVNI